MVTAHTPPASWRPSRFSAPAGDRVGCTLCPLRCELAEGEQGFCGTRIRSGEGIWSTIYGLASHIEVEPIEKKTIYHFAPGARLLSLGSYGCTWRCGHCHNWRFACVEQVGGSDRIQAPDGVVKRALGEGCAGIGWGFNEPVLSAEFIMDTMEEARGQGLFGVMATNGALTPEARRALAPLIDAWRFDIKGFSDGFYEALGVPGRWREILESAIELKHRYARHLEIVTVVVPGMNDEQVADIAAWIARELGPDTPYHLMRFFPERFLTEPPMTSVNLLRDAADRARDAGLRYVYVSSGASGGSDTVCADCGTVVVKRSRNGRVENLTVGGRCAHCSSPVVEDR